MIRNSSLKYLVMILMGSLLFSSCGTTSKKTSKKSSVSKKEGEEKGGVPEWTTSPVDFCGAGYLCTVGEGTGRNVAEMEARKELAKVFRVRVSGSSSVKTQTFSKDNPDGVLMGDTTQDYVSQLKESVDEILEGVIIKDTYSDEESYYALASLDKRKAAQGIKSKIQQIDEQISSFYKDGRRHALFQALRLFKLRNSLDLRHEFLSEMKVRPQIRFEQVLKKKRAKAALSTVAFIKVDEFSELKELKTLMVKLFIENDLRLVTSKSKSHQFKILGNLSFEEKYLKIKGFKKFKFNLAIVTQNGKGEKIGAIDFSTEEMGRDITQCYEKGLPKIKSFILENLGLLNID